MIKLEDVYKAVRKILPEGELYAVGGCVRDYLLNKSPKDWDFCTNLTPAEMKPFIKAAGRKVYEIGEKFGTLGFKVPVMEFNDYDYEEDWGPQWHAMETFIRVEVTTYRSEKYTPGSRHPVVEFGDSLRTDLQRRDFTINSLAYDGEDIVDLFAGELDLVRKRIKSVGEPKKMLTDDPLRILRAIRFSTQLDFEIEENLFRHLKRFCPKLFDVAVERQTVELDKMFSFNAEKALLLLYDIGYLELFIPELIDSTTGTLKRNNRKLTCADIDEIWKVILSVTGEKYKGPKNKKDSSICYLTNDNFARTKFLNKGISARYKFSNQRLKKIVGEE